MDRISVASASLSSLGYASFPYAVLSNAKLSAGAKLVFGLMLNKAWEGNSLSHATLSRELAIPAGTIRRHVNELVAARLLRVSRRPGRSNLYTIVV